MAVALEARRGAAVFAPALRHRTRTSLHDQATQATLNVEVSREPRLIQSAAGVSLAGARAADLANQGYRALGKQDYETALWYSLQALAIDPRLAQAHTNAGIAYYKKGMLAEAVSHWRESLALEPANDAVRKLLEKAAQPHP
jgi:tetratricopeptide (TPR) repeat protein